MIKSHLLSSAILAVFIAGCSAPGMLVYRQPANAPGMVGQAPGDGNYGLFLSGQSDELLEFPLKKDAALGFDWGDDGPVRYLYAIAGASRTRLDVTKSYEWRRMPADPGMVKSAP